MSNPNEEARKEEEKGDAFNEETPDLKSRFQGEPPFDKAPERSGLSHTGGDAVKVTERPVGLDVAKAEQEEMSRLESMRGAPIPDIDTAKKLIGEMALSGAKIQGGGLFDNRGYLVTLSMTTARIGTDGFIELHPAGLPAIRVPLHVKELFALTKGVASLIDQGKVEPRD